MSWLETVAPMPVVQADDVPIDRADVQTSSRHSWRNSPRSPQEQAREMVVQAAMTVPAQRFIKSRIETLARDHAKYGGTPPPGVDDVLASLRTEVTTASCATASEWDRPKPTPDQSGFGSRGLTIPEGFAILAAAFLSIVVFVFVYIRLAPIRSILTATETAAAGGLLLSAVLFAMGVSLIVDWRRRQRLKHAAVHKFA
jgi:hypothetical protein